MPTWRFRALGPAELRDADQGTTLYPERKTAALLLYLSLEGPSSRSRLAGLLWPDSSESAARNNLSQTLRRLRLTTGQALILGDDTLRLSPELSVDAALRKVALFTGEDGDSPRGNLLANYDYDDCPDFADWLYSETEALQDARRQQLAARRDEAEAKGDLSRATLLGEKLLEHDPLSESAYRQLMRLYYQTGDRGAALRVYQRCREALARELGVLPLPETEALARRIDQGGVSAPARPPKQELPLELLRPPRLIGRTDAWQRMEQAWDEGRAIFVRGPAGVGKTRLLRDFAASRGAFRVFEGRGGDRSVPYASQTRLLREALADLDMGALEPWVVLELSRLLPELGSSPGPVSSEAEQLRFLEAQVRVFAQLAQQGPLLALVDDLQAIDPASLIAQRYIYGTLMSAPGTQVRALFAYRSGEVPQEIEAGILQQVAAEQAVLIELGSLDEGAVLDLLGDLAPGNAAVLSAGVLRYTGGNPLFIVETVRHLHQQGRLSAGFPERLPPPEKLSGVIQERLKHLSSGAQRAAQAASVLSGELNLDVLGAVLGSDPLELLEPLAELERFKILSGQRFSHELLREAISQGLSAPVAALLHTRALQALTARGAPSALLAQHAEQAGLQAQAAQHHLQAAEEAMRVFLLSAAARHYERAHALLLAAPDLLSALPPKALRELYYQFGFILVYTNALAEARTLYLEALDIAKRTLSPELEWLAYNKLAYLALHDGNDLAGAAAHLERAIGAASQADDPRLLIEAQQEAAGLYTLAFEPGLAWQHAEAALELAEGLFAQSPADGDLLGRSLLEAELASWQQGRWQLSLELLGRAAQLYAQSGNAALEARSRHSLAFDLVASGQAASGGAAAQHALRLSRRAKARREEVNAAGVLALALREQGKLAEALNRAEEGVSLARSLDVPVLAILSLRRLALVQMDLFALHEAEASLAEATALSERLARRPRSGEIATLRCRLAHLQSEPETALAQARQAALARDFREAEAWISRGPVLASLAQAGEGLLETARDACLLLLAKSPRHRLEGLLSLAPPEPGPARARAMLQEAAELAETLALPLERWRAQLELSRCLARLRRVQEAETALARAHALSDELAQALPQALQARFRAGAKGVVSGSEALR